MQTYKKKNRQKVCMKIDFVIKTTIFSFQPSMNADIVRLNRTAAALRTWSTHIVLSVIISFFCHSAAVKFSSYHLFFSAIFLYGETLAQRYCAACNPI